jgi:STE24 endopeptidase
VRRDNWRLLALSAGLAAFGMAGAWAGVELAAPDGPGHLIALPSAVLGYGLASALASPLAAAYSRRRERAADRYALELTREGETYAAAFERLAEQNLAELDPPRLYHLLTASHPALRERIETARGWQD